MDRGPIQSDARMARYLGPKVKLSRRVGVPIADIPKHTSKRQLNPPGQHGFRGRRPKDYGIRKDEKQKLRYHYNVMEKQFRRYVDEATRRPGNTGELLLQLVHLVINILELGFHLLGVPPRPRAAVLLRAGRVRSKRVPGDVQLQQVALRLEGEKDSLHP